jgi:hypothetical protein
MSHTQAPQFPEFRVLAPSEAEEVYQFSRARWLAHPESSKDLFLEWSAPWRKESLDHYLKLGWSMARRDPHTGGLLGYALAQPILFFRKQTQTVWIEHVDAESPRLAEEIVDTLIRVSREKHIQRVLMGFRETDLGLGEVIRTRNGRMIEDDILEFPTTKG